MQATGYRLEEDQAQDLFPQASSLKPQASRKRCERCRKKRSIEKFGTSWGSRAVCYDCRCRPKKKRRKCRICEDMPHRRPPEGCWACELPYVPEPAQALDGTVGLGSWW